MAKEIPLQRITIPASGDLSSSRYRGVVIDSSGQADATPTAGAAIDGILQNKPDAAGKAAAVEVGFGAVSFAECGAAVAAGAELMVEADGQFITATTGNVVVAKALEAGSGAGSVIGVLFYGRGKTVA